MLNINGKNLPNAAEEMGQEDFDRAGELFQAIMDKQNDTSEEEEALDVGGVEQTSQGGNLDEMMEQFHELEKLEEGLEDEEEMAEKTESRLPECK